MTMVFRDDLPEVRAMPEGQRRLVSVALGWFALAMGNIHDTSIGFLGAESDLFEARKAATKLRKLQAKTENRRHVEKERGLTAGQMRRA